jgi:hypothetical protein
METAKVILNKENPGSRGPKTFTVQNQRISIPGEIKPLRYSYVLVGNPLDI